MPHDIRSSDTIVMKSRMAMLKTISWEARYDPDVHLADVTTRPRRWVHRVAVSLACVGLVRTVHVRVSCSQS